MKDYDSKKSQVPKTKQTKIKITNRRSDSLYYFRNAQKNFIFNKKFWFQVQQIASSIPEEYSYKILYTILHNFQKKFDESQLTRCGVGVPEHSANCDAHLAGQLGRQGENHSIAACHLQEAGSGLRIGIPHV